MKKILLLFIFTIIIIGCGEYKDTHVTFKRTLNNITIETPQGILDILETNKQDTLLFGPLSSKHIWGTYGSDKAEIVNLKKAIVIPFLYEGKKLHMLGHINMSVYLSDNKEAKVQVINGSKNYSGDNTKTKEGVIILTPELMREKNLLNEDNTVKSDLCFDAMENIDRNRDEHFVVTKEEMDRAIVEYENF